MLRWEIGSADLGATTNQPGFAGWKGTIGKGQHRYCPGKASVVVSTVPVCDFNV